MMIAEVVARSLSEVKHNGRIFVQKHFFTKAHFNYKISYRNIQKNPFLNKGIVINGVLNERKFTTPQQDDRQSTPCKNTLQQLTHFKTNGTIFARTNFGHRSNDIIFNTVRQYSSSPEPLEDLIPNIDEVIAKNIFYRNSGYLQDLSESQIVEYMQSTLLSLHSNSGLPWWAIIMLTTIVLRTSVTLPLAFYQHYIFAKIEFIKLEMNDIVKRLKAEANYSVQHLGWSEAYAGTVYAKSLKQEWQNLILRDNCHPMKGAVLLLTQLPLWICLSLSVRNITSIIPRNDPLSYKTYQEFTVGGVAWFTNLTEIDHYFIFPVFLGLTNLLITEIQYMLKIKENQTRIGKIITNIMRVVSILLIPISMPAPSSLTLYWATSSSCGLLQNLLLASPKIRRFVGIPRTPSELQHPYTELLAVLKSRLNFKKGDVKSATKL